MHPYINVKIISRVPEKVETNTLRIHAGIKACHIHPTPIWLVVGNKLTRCNMKDKLIEIFDFKFISKTKWNEVWGNDYFTMIYNPMTKLIKIKPN